VSPLLHDIEGMVRAIENKDAGQLPYIIANIAHQLGGDPNEVLSMQPQVAISYVLALYIRYSEALR